MSTVSPPRNSLRASVPPEGWDRLVRAARFARRPLERFLHVQASSGIVLIAAAALALAWANSPWAGAYERSWHTPVGVQLGALRFERDLAWVVNDVLMTVFFFVVGLEIRRELHHGELSSWRRVALPAAAALGGMIVPALFYLGLAREPAWRPGWGVPMATDIAFALGVLALLGSRVPAPMRVLLLGLAVIDDLGAIVIIAAFYSSPGSAAGLLVAALGVVVIVLLQRFGVRSKIAYGVPATAVWVGAQMAGVHPAIAGVLVGLLTPVRAWLGAEGFVAHVRAELDRLSAATPASSLRASWPCRCRT